MEERLDVPDVVLPGEPRPEQEPEEEPEEEKEMFKLQKSLLEGFNSGRPA